MQQVNHTGIGGADSNRSFGQVLQHRIEVERRSADDLQHIAGRGLLLQRLAPLSQEPRVLHCDDRLRREVLQ